MSVGWMQGMPHSEFKESIYFLKATFLTHKSSYWAVYACDLLPSFQVIQLHPALWTLNPNKGQIK